MRAGFCDGRPTRWYFDQLQASKTVSGGTDPRLDATIFYNAPGMMVYNRTFQDRYGNDANLRNEIFSKKYGDYYLSGTTEQDWDSGINFRVIRFSDVLPPGQGATAGQTGPAAQLITACARVGASRRPRRPPRPRCATRSC